MPIHCFLIFESIHKVMKAEALLKSHNVKFDLVPTPKTFSSDCGMSVRLLKDSSELEKAIHVLKTDSLSYKIFEITKEI